MKKIIGIIIGGVFLVLGIASMVKPVQVFLELGWLAGALLLGHGMERIWILVSEKRATAKTILVRIMESLAGAAVLGCTVLGFLTDLLICKGMSILVILAGVYFILKGFKTEERRSAQILKGAIGLIIVGLGFVLLNEPEGTMLAIVYTLATALALLGADIIMISLMGRKEAFVDNE